MSEFIKLADFPIIYKKIKHGGKHIATREAYKYSSGLWSIELDSDDELYDKNAIKLINKLIKTVPDAYSCICGCFIDQNNKVFPAIRQEYIDFDQKKYLDYFCDNNNNNILNVSWVCKTKYATSVLPPITTDNLSYYPEAVVNVHRVLKHRCFHMRLFNISWYRYYTYNADSVTVNTNSTNAMWYYAKGLLEVFFEYKMLDKYHTYLNMIAKILFNDLPKNKSIADNYKIFKGINKLTWFYRYYLRWLLKQIFCVYTEDSKKVFLICGHAFYKGKRDENI